MLPRRERVCSQLIIVRLRPVGAINHAVKVGSADFQLLSNETPNPIGDILPCVGELGEDQRKIIEFKLKPTMIVRPPVGAGEAELSYKRSLHFTVITRHSVRLYRLFGWT